MKHLLKIHWPLMISSCISTYEILNTGCISCVCLCEISFSRKDLEREISYYFLKLGTNKKTTYAIQFIKMVNICISYELLSLSTKSFKEKKNHKHRTMLVHSFARCFMNLILKWFFFTIT